jgi:hypothetical protein
VLPRSGRLRMVSVLVKTRLRLCGSIGLKLSRLRRWRGTRTQQTQTIASQYEERISELQQQIAPLRDQQTQTLFESSIDLLEGQIPDLADYSEKIQAYVDNIPTDQLHLAFFPQGMDTSEKIQEGIKSLYAIVRMREAPMQPQQQGNVNQNAFTQSRQGIADTGPTDYDAKINAAILQG